MPQSLFDTVDLERLRAATSHAAGPAGTVVTCLLRGGAFHHDPADAGWADRDRFVLGAPLLRADVAAAFTDAGYERGGGWYDVVPAAALAVSFGCAAASAMDGGIYRVWCMLDPLACEQGGTWEAALAAAEAGAAGLVAVVVDTRPVGPGPAERLFTAAGWLVLRTEAEPVALLGALDHVLAAAAPAAVVVS